MIETTEMFRDRFRHVPSESISWVMVASYDGDSSVNLKFPHGDRCLRGRTPWGASQCEHD